MSENSSSSSDLKMKIHELQSTLKSSEESRLSLNRQLEALRRKMNEMDSKQAYADGEIELLQREVKTGGCRLEEVQNALSNAQKVCY